MTEIKELVEFLDDLRHTLAGLSWSKYSRVDLISNLVKIKGIMEQKQRREKNPWFCPECGEEYNGCCKEHIMRQGEK